MMSRAGGYHAVRGVAIVVLVTILGFASYEGHGRLQAHALRRRLLDADTTQVLTIVQDMAPYRRWLNPLLTSDPLLIDDIVWIESSLESAPAPAPAPPPAPPPTPTAAPTSVPTPVPTPVRFLEADSDDPDSINSNPNYRQRLNLRLALLSVDNNQIEPLYQLMMSPQTDAGNFYLIRSGLLQHKDELVDRLWVILENEQEAGEQRLRAACALAKFADTDSRWKKVCRRVAEFLVSKEQQGIYEWREQQGIYEWRERLLPIRQQMADALSANLSSIEKNDVNWSKTNDLFLFYTNANNFANALSGSTSLRTAPNMIGD